MPTAITIMRTEGKTMVFSTGDEKQLAEALISAAFRNEIISEAITRAAIEIELKRMADQKLIEMTK